MDLFSRRCLLSSWELGISTALAIHSHEKFSTQLLSRYLLLVFVRPKSRRKGIKGAWRPVASKEEEEWNCLDSRSFLDPRLPTQVVDAPSLETLKVRLDGAPSIWLICRCLCSLQGGWTRWPSKIRSNSNYSMLRESIFHVAQSFLSRKWDITLFDVSCHSFGRKLLRASPRTWLHSTSWQWGWDDNFCVTPQSWDQSCTQIPLLIAN